MELPKSTEDNDFLVAVFTKDRIHHLYKTLPRLPTNDYDFILLDDSTIAKCQIEAKKLCEKYGLIYHGSNEQKKFIKQIKSPLISKFVINFSVPEWTLGYARNYAFLFGRNVGKNKMLMMDDDIILKAPNDIDKIFHCIKDFQYAGARINRMPDDSIVGHTYRAGGEIQKRYVSASFLAFDMDKISNYFLNVYNEDWIWLFLETDGKEVETVVDVFHMTYNPFENAERKALFQEKGEILWEGTYLSPINKRKETLVNPTFWKEILEHRKKQVEYFNLLQIPKEVLPIAQQLNKVLLNYIQTLQPNYFAEFFQNYFNSRDDWRILLEEMLP
jgi:hypothetical protein